MNAGTLSGEGRLHKVADLDKQLAVVVVGFPLLGSIAAVWLWASGWGPTATDWWLFGTFYVGTMVGIECGYHRLFAHRSFKTSVAVECVLAVLGAMAFQGPVIWWAATHRRHHQCTDEIGDPHSPLTADDGSARTLWGGFWHSHVGWLFEANSTRPDGWAKIVKDLYQRPHLFALHMSYFVWLPLGYVIPTVIGAAVDGGVRGALLGLLWGGAVRTFLVHHFIWALNSVCHLVGTQAFKVARDMSHNVSWLALPTFGQGWHNNHHAFPSSAKVGLAWWQVDLTWSLLKFLSWVGLVWDLRTVSQEQLERRAAGKEAMV